MDILEAQGVRNLEADMRLTGIVFLAAGETFSQFCERIAAEYGLTLETARTKLGNYQHQQSIHVSNSGTM